MTYEKIVFQQDVPTAWTDYVGESIRFECGHWAWRLDAIQDLRQYDAELDWSSPRGGRFDRIKFNSEAGYVAFCLRWSP